MRERVKEWKGKKSLTLDGKSGVCACVSVFLAAALVLLALYRWAPFSQTDSRIKEIQSWIEICIYILSKKHTEPFQCSSNKEKMVNCQKLPASIPQNCTMCVCTIHTIAGKRMKGSKAREEKKRTVRKIRSLNAKKESPEAIASIMHTFEKAFLDSAHLKTDQLNTVQQSMNMNTLTAAAHECEKSAVENIPFTCLFASQPACLLASHLSCAKSAFPTLSYFYSLALYLVYVRALRIACEHLWVSHTKNEPNGGGESTRTPAIRTTLCIEYIFYTYVSCAGWLAGWLSLWSHGFYRLFFQWARAHKHIAFGVSFKC